MSDAAASLPWNAIIEALHALLGAMVARTQYPLGHPAVARADDLAAAVFRRLHEEAAELVVAVVDGEFIVAERPMPELHDCLPALAAAYARHHIECLVFMRGLDKEDIAALGDALARQPEEGREAASRDEIRASTRHVLVRFLDVRGDDGGRAGAPTADYVVPEIEALLYSVAGAIEAGAPVDLDSVRGTSRRLLARVAQRSFRLALRTHEERADLAAHAANVAMMAGAMLLEAGLAEVSASEGVAAALLHDIGKLLLPEDIRRTPEPLLDAHGRSLYRHHPFLGARALLGGGCPSLWVAVALEHHRGVDGHGYPALQASSPPHDAVAVVSLANYLDDKRASLPGDPASSVGPDGALGQALSLAGRYFDAESITLFLRGVGVYPPGTVVELSDGAYAIVTRANPNDPRRPEVEMLFGPYQAKRFELRDFDAVEQRFFRFIVRAAPPPLVEVVADTE